MKFFTNAIQVLLFVVLVQQKSISQSCPTINAQAGTGASTTICRGQCANLTATLIPVKATSTYSVGAIAYTPFSFTGGVTLPSIDDVWSDSINIGFNFCFFGNTFNKLVVGSNGEINFNKLLANSFNNYNVSTTLPNTIDLPGNSICGVFKDIDLSAGGVARTYTTGVAPCRKFVTYWNNVPLYESPSDNCGTILNSFQIVLHENTNYIDVYVASTSPCGIGGNTDRGIIGIQDAAGTTAFAPPGRNVLTPWTGTNEAWRFTPDGAPTYTVNWSGPSGFTATGLTAAPCPTATSNYTATMNVVNCDGTTTSYSSVVQVSVAPIPVPVATPTAICIGSSSTLTAVGATSYTWSPGGLTTSSIVVSPTVTTTYTLTTLTGLCVNTSTVRLVVNALPNITAVSNPVAICSSGGSATLTSTGGTSYTWNPGGLTGNVVVVSPTITTQYTVTGVNANGCARTRAVNVTVSASPVITANTFSATVCAGSTTTLTTSGATAYTWTPGPVTGATVVVTPTANTTYTVRGANAAGCIDTETISISVTPGISVTATSSPTILCSGQSSTLTAGGATTYTWFPGAIAGSSISVTPSVTTIYSVTGTASGCTNTRTVSVVVNTPVITITKAPALTCAGSTATLTATGAGNYTWSPGGATSTSIAITPTANTVYTVVGTNTMGCLGTRTLNVIITANPTITIGATSASICTGSSSTLTAGGGTSYTWSPVTSTLTSIVVSPTTTTTYSLTGRNASGCVVTNTLSLFVAPMVTVTPMASPAVICSGSTSTLTASGATNYTWNPGALTGSNVAVSPTVTTTYSVVGATPLGCVNNATVEVAVSIVNINATSNPTILCSSNSATLTGTGAVTYTWSPGALTGNTIAVTPAATTVYTINGTDMFGCTGTNTLNLSVGITPTITAAASSTLVCSGTTLTLSSNGASTYTWMPGALTGSVVTVSPSVTTTFTVIGQNAEGCTTTNTVDVSVNPSPVVIVNSNPTVLCPGFSATLTATGAPTFTWNPGAIANGTIVVTPPSTTIYSVVGTSALGCTGSGTINLKVNPSPVVTATSSTGTICAGATATLTGGGANSYTWNPGGLIGTNITVSPAISTIYTVTGDNGLGCIATETVSVDVLPALTVTASSSPTAICAGNSATLTVTGGATYTWSPGNLTGNTIVVTPTATTLYTVTAESVFGCTTTETVSLMVSSPTVTAVSNTSVICSGGGATLTANGGLTYTWSPGVLTGSVVAVNPTITTIYTVTGTDVSGCTNTNTVNLIVSSIPVVSASASPTTICAGNTSTLTGSGAVSYTWNPGNNIGLTNVVSPAVTTTYTVIGENIGGCSSTNTIVVDVSPAPTLTATTSSSVICSGTSVLLSASGATSYTWNPGNINSALTIVTPSATTVYTVEGNNVGLCNGSATVEVIVNITPTVIATSSPTILCAAGSATLTASGATDYVWNPGSVIGSSVVVTPTITTDYTVTGVSGACSNTISLNLVVGTAPVISASASSTAICAGTSVTLTSGGAATYTWNPGALTGTNVVVNPTITTTYTVDGDNGSGCIASQTVSVNVNTLPTLTITATPTVLCSAGSITLTASGATSYTWNPTAATTASIVDTPSLTTTYTVTGEDAFGCSNTQTLTVNVGPPVITLASTSTVICAGASATLTANGALTYTWNPGSITGTTAIVTPTSTTTYTVDGDNGSCIGTQTITIDVSPYPVLNLTSTSGTICAGVTTTLSANGAVSYTWNPGAITGTNVAVSPTITTTYTVDGDNGVGCISTETITINVNAAPSISITATPTVLCAAGSVTLTASGADTYTWNPTSATTSSVVDTPTLTTTYSVTGTDLLGCSNTQTLTVNVGPPAIAISSNPAAICIGGTATLTASGATSYTWSPGALTGSNVAVTPTTTTTYTVQGDDGLCIGTQTITIVASPSAVVNLSATSNTICAGITTTLTAAGATSYTWNPGVLTGTNVAVTPTVTTTYTVDGDNGLGCITSETITVNVNAAPILSITATPTVLCAAGSVTLTASGADTYTWNPTGELTAGIVDTPTLTTTYSVTGTDMNGCLGNQTITISVGNPVVNITSTSSLICVGSTATLTANGAVSYTWSPLSVSGSTVTDSPAMTTTYTVIGDNGFGCTSTNTFVLTVSNGPLITAATTATNICSGSTVSLSANGATNYTWMPGGSNGTPITETPTVSTTYTVTGDDGVCTSTATIFVNVNTSPQNVTAVSNGTITCATPTIGLTGNSTSAGITYIWTGPASYTSAVQNPTDIIAEGDYTLSVVDPLTGCGTTATTTVMSNTIIPVVGVATPGPVLGCNSTVTLSVITAPTPTLIFNWSGPSGFTSTVETPTTSVAGDYTLTVTDPVNGCGNTVTITVGTSTLTPAYSVSVVPATCTGSLTNNDGTILISGNSASDTYDISQAATYTGTATYITGTTIPFSGILTNTLTNPAVSTPYTIRVFSNNGCIKDTTVMLDPVICNIPANVLGMTKAVSTPTFVSNNAYNVTYTIVATNASAVDLTNFSIIDNLNATFPLPSTFSVISTPVVTSLNSSLTINASYDGSLQNDLTTPLSSTLAAGKKDTIVFTVQINPNGFFGPFYNSAVGYGTDNNGVVVSDSSNTGFAWDPDGDGDPTNNDTATVVNLIPNTQIGVAKSGTVSGILSDKTLDVTYVITVKNFGNDTITFVQVLDSLVIPTPAMFTVKSGPTATGSLVANNNYNGNSDIGLLVSNSSILAPGEVQTITFVINVTPNGLRSITNTAIGAGFGYLGNVVRDSSNAGTEPDPNGNGNAVEHGENIPTIVELPDVNLFIPEVFTPDGDGKNDLFVIKGIEGRVVNLTVFNRWGSKVYENSAYDNTWNGTPNVSGLIIGSNKLPQGTYYYIVEFEDGNDKAINGYVVLQY